jgi:hypothetical protein
MAMSKLVFAGMFCFLAGIAWTAIVFAEVSRKARAPGIGVIVGVPRAAELLCVAGFALLFGACPFALEKTIRRRLNA